jgi:hypothetical protein
MVKVTLKYGYDMGTQFIGGSRSGVMVNDGTDLWFYGSHNDWFLSM